MSQVTLNGDNPVTINQNDTYVDAGINTPTGGGLTVANTVNTAVVGTYYVNYIYFKWTFWNTIFEARTRTVNVVNNNTAPVLIINGDNPEIVEKGSSYSEIGATSDGGEVVTSTTNLDTNSIGTYTTTYSATDEYGNTANLTRTIYVVNANGPTITINGDNPVTIEKDSIYNDAWATSDGGETVIVTTNFDRTTAGMYIINYSATDLNGTIVTARRLVIVVDTTEPVITLIGQNPVTIEQGSTYTDAGATANGGETVTSYSNIDTSKVGRYTVTYTATDTNGNTGTAIRTVDVDVLDGTFAPIDFSQYVNPNKNENNISGELIGNDGEVYYREYSFIDRAFDYDTIKQQQLDEHVETLKHENKEDRDTKAQIYANKVRGKWIHRTTSFASQGNANTITNPNTKNYLRIDANDKIINEKYEQPIPNINTPLPYMNQVNSETIYTSNNILDVSYNSSKKDKSTIVIPIVKNDDLPVEQEIVKGGILYAGTNFNKADDREKLEPNLYKFSEQAIVSSEFADKFNIDIENTYDKAELEEITGKTFLELYPDYPSWEKNKFHGSVHFTQPDNGNTGDFLPSMYSATNYVYDSVNNQYVDMVITINMFAPVGDNVNEANDGNGTRVSQNTKYSIFRI